MKKISNGRNIWANEWGYTNIFSQYSSSKAGVAILFNNNFEFELLKKYSDPEGRFIIADIKTSDKIITLANVHAPNKDEPDFFQKVTDYLLDFTGEDIILGGDFNLVQDINVDKKGGNPKTHTKSLRKLREISDNLDLNDIWRVMHPDERRFTWRQRNPEIHCRLDFFLISQGLCSYVTQSDILPGYRTDHSLITLSISMNSNPVNEIFQTVECVKEVI